MPGCTTVIGELGQAAYDAALGFAVIYSNGGTAASFVTERGPLFKEEICHRASAVAAPGRHANALIGPITLEPLKREGIREQPIAKRSLRVSDESIRVVDGFVIFGDGGDLEAHLGSDATAGDSSGDMLPAVELSSSQAQQIRGPDGRSAEEAAAGQAPEMAIDGDEVETDGIKMAQAPGGGLRLNAGYSSVEGVSVGIRVTRTNIFGPATELSASARYSNIRTSFEYGYADRNFLGSKYTLAPTLFFDRVSSRNFGSQRDLARFRQTAQGVSVQLSRKFEKGLSATFNYRLSRDSTQLVGQNAGCDAATLSSAVCGTLGNATRSILSFAATLDRTRQNTGRGFRVQIVQDWSVGGSASFVRSRLRGEAILGLSESWNLSLNAEGGHIRAFNGDAIPLFDRFFIGDSKMRGFDLRGMGPKIQPTGAQANETVAIGGRAFYVARAELSFRAGGLPGTSGVRPGIFIDAGSVFLADRSGLLVGEKLLGNSAKPRVSVGIGLTMYTPAGSLRIDVAEAVVKQMGDRPRMLSISFGTAF